MSHLDSLLKSPSLALFRELLQKEPSLLIESLWDAPKAALLLLAAQAKKRDILILTAAEKEDRLWENFDYFGLRNKVDFPSWESLPGEEIPPSPDIVGKRFETLFQLLQKKEPSLVLCPLQACLQKLLPPPALRSLCSVWTVGEEKSFSDLPAHLTSLGYRRSTVASDKGEFAVRGGILDLFPVSSPSPYRIDFFGDTIDQIRSYDPIGQKSMDKVSSLFLSPAIEHTLTSEEQSPCFLLDYLSKDTLVIFDGLLELEDKYVSLQKRIGVHSRFFATLEELLETIAPLQKFYWSLKRVEELSEVNFPKKTGRHFYSGKEPLQPLSFQIFQQEIHTKRWRHPFLEISDYFASVENRAAATPDELLEGIKLASHSPLEFHFISSTLSEENSFKERLKEKQILLPQNTSFESGYLSSGFVVSDSLLVLFPMTEWTHRYKVRREKWRNTYHTPPSDFHALSPGDVVVHFHNGIGKFLGIEKRPNHMGSQTEFMILEYAEESKLYVPLSQAHLVSRYIGAKEEIPHLSNLGSQRWLRTRAQAQKAILGYAEQLLQMSAERTIKGGFTFSPDGPELIQFEEEFPFVETEDQLLAIAAVKSDMTSHKAMDRLICGDVGYGKTEVAMRAAFKAVLDGKKQVAVLVPTTVLAMQHYETFVSRMANFPLSIAVISRFRTPKEIKETLRRVKEGSIDILIGTHRLISKDVIFKDLGLLIIDEEQRFGVRAKETLKALKTGVDCLTLSATPIPRTLYLSLMGAREISVINTPPQDRLPIKTVIVERDPALIQRAFLRELSRDGQAFFIHNRVESIFSVTEELQKLLPEARFVTAHGQMSSDEIDCVFHAFKTGNADILVATTLIENGVDIPNANTILIDRSDQFGLADLYQLRGRVGRWNRPAYAYFLVPQKRELAELSRKRLFALVEASGYGGGMKIAMRDLEIRGAGDLLGTQQSGQISAIGFHLYCKLLKRTVDSLAKKLPSTFLETKMEFAYEASLPDAYVNETSLRMEIYHRLGEAVSLEEIDSLFLEIKDRFGPPPPQVFWLYHLTRLRVFASLHQFTLLKFDKLTFTAEQKKGKTTLKKTLLLPRSKKPEELEKEVIKTLQENFPL